MPSPARARPRTAADALASELPVARVAVDLGLAHLDRPFDYAVPASMAENAVPGCRVRVRVAGRQLDGFILERRSETDFGGKLQRLTRVVSAEPVLSAELAELSRRVADRYAGVQADVLRLTVPPRVAKVEAAPSADRAAPPPLPGTSSWDAYEGGAELLTRISRGGAPRAVWDAHPGCDWPASIAAAVQAALSADRGAVVVVPDAADVARLDDALAHALGPGRHTTLMAEAGPSERYRRWLAVRRGAVRAVVGTRAAMFAPVHDPGLFLVWDDGDDLHAEPRAPYPHVREVLALRAVQHDAAFVMGGVTRTAEAQRAVATGWARAITPARSVVRAAAPLVRALGDDAEAARDPLARAARLPRLAWETVRDGLRAGPVLVQVPRAGAAGGLSCAACRTPVRCASCHGILTGGAPGPSGWSGGTLTCRACGLQSAHADCPACGSADLRAGVIGVRRTADELARGFPRAEVLVSSGEGRLPSVGSEPRLVVATPGAEPVADGGYAAVLLLDGWALLLRPDLRAGEEALRRWLNAATLARPADAGGRVVVAAEPSAAATQALLRWDPAWYAARELEDRRALRFPPEARMASLEGSPAAVRELLASLTLPTPSEVSDPMEIQSDHAGHDLRSRVLVRVPRSAGAALARTLQEAQAVQSAAKSAQPVRVQIDPLSVG